jgi:CheY-specific phosphatase CheX
MNEAWTAALERAIRDVFESLCFMMPAPQGTTPPEPTSGSWVVVTVDVRGAGQGSLRLVLPASMVALVASAMLGEDGPLELAEQCDAACELANILCGNVLPRVAGERAVFDLSTPRVLLTTELDLSTSDDVNVEVLLDEGLVLASLSLRLEESAGAA